MTLYGETPEEEARGVRGEYNRQQELLMRLCAVADLAKLFTQLGAENYRDIEGLQEEMKIALDALEK